MDRACTIIASHGVGRFITAGAFHATMGSRTADAIGALLDSISTRGGALREVSPSSNAILWAALIVADLLLNCVMDVWALCTTILSLHSDSVFARLRANGTIALTVSALLTAFGPFAPRSFTRNGAWIIAAGLNLHVAMLMRAIRATMLCRLRHFEGS
jgi:hypothetical protein